MKHWCIMICLAGCSAPQAVPEEVPEEAARLSVAKCGASTDIAVEAFDQQLKPVGELRLFAEPELQGALGGVDDKDVLHARKVSDGVWAILVTDYDKRVCEAFISEDNAEIVSNEPGPEPAPEQPE